MLRKGRELLPIGNGLAGPQGTWVALAAAAATLAVASACGGGPGPQEACLRFDSSPNLNLYDGQPHVVTLYIYPLSSTAGFQRATIDDLLGGATPYGVLGKPVHLTIAPGEVAREFEDLFPMETTHVGLVADYYRTAGDPEGTRRQVVEAKCGRGKPKVTLSTKDMYVQ